MKKLLMVGLLGLSAMSANAKSYSEMKAHADAMSDTVLCTTMGIAVKLAEMGKDHNPQALRQMNVIFLDRFEAMDEDQQATCGIAFAMGQMSAEEQ